MGWSTSRTFQARLDELVEDLELSLEEREWIRERNRKHPEATRAVNLMGEYLEARRLQDRQGLLKALFEAVQDVRAAMAAEVFDLPKGFALVEEPLLTELRKTAIAALQARSAKGATRSTTLARMYDHAVVVLNLDEEVREAVGELAAEEEEA